MPNKTKYILEELDTGKIYAHTDKDEHISMFFTSSAYRVFEEIFEYRPSFEEIRIGSLFCCLRNPDIVYIKKDQLMYTIYGDGSSGLIPAKELAWSEMVFIGKVFEEGDIQR